MAGVEFVLDTSVAMAWFFEDESNSYTESILDNLRSGKAFVPGIWMYEVGNVLAMAERRNRATQMQSRQFVELLGQLPIEIVIDGKNIIWSDALNLARENEITVYDAAYLELAIRKALPLTTQDGKLKQVCSKIGIKNILSDV